jgi:polar amino acid transport system substrate-binding protein
MISALARALATGSVACAAIAATACGPNADQTVSAHGSIAVPPGLSEPGSLTVALPAALPPYGFRGRDGRSQGFAVDLATAMADRLGVHLRVVALDPPDLLAAGRGGGVDVVVGTTPLATTTAPPPGYHLVPYLRGSTELVVRADSAFQPRQLSELCGQRVAVVAGTRQETLLAQAATACGPAPPRVDAVSGDSQAIDALESGNAVVVADSATAAYDKATRGGVMSTSPTFDDVELGLALRSDTAILEDAITRAFFSAHSDGTYEVLVKKWGLTAESL